jgi:hypothetical protein
MPLTGVSQLAILVMRPLARSKLPMPLPEAVSNCPNAICPLIVGAPRPKRVPLGKTTLCAWNAWVHASGAWAMHTSMLFA